MHPCCRASAWILIALAADPAAALAASPRKGKATRPAGGGFGAAASKQTSLDAAAKRLLKEAGGDVDAAQEKSFQNAMRALSRSEPELFEAWPSLDSGVPPAPDAASGDAGAHGGQGRASDRRGARQAG